MSPANYSLYLELQVPKADVAKLFLHKMLVDVPSEELLQMFSEYNIVEVQVCCFVPLV